MSKLIDSDRLEQALTAVKDYVDDAIASVPSGGSSIVVEQDSMLFLYSCETGVYVGKGSTSVRADYTTSAWYFYGGYTAYTKKSGNTVSYYIIGKDQLNDKDLHIITGFTTGASPGTSGKGFTEYRLSTMGGVTMDQVNTAISNAVGNALGGSY